MLYATLVGAETRSPSTARNRAARNGRLIGAGLALAAALALAGCGGGSGAATQVNPGSGGGPAASSYSGPAPSTADINSFKINLWENIRTANRCGGCHSVEGGQTPMFARSDDVNLAYAAANGVVTLTSPKDSTMVVKVGGGHNCWLASNAACGDILETWITNWAGSLANGGGRQIQLEVPPSHSPGQSKNFPASAGDFQGTVYPVLSQFCSNCHSSGSTVKQQPFFAEGPSNDPDAVAAAYEAAKAKMDLDDPANSRFVLRLRNEFHNCWVPQGGNAPSCTTSADVMQAAIQAFADQVPLTQVDPALLTSKALTLYEGTIASGGNRYETSMVALYEFKTGQTCGASITGACATAFDTSGVEPAMDLHLSGSVEWVGGWGLKFTTGKAQASTATSSKLRTLINATGEYSIEAWVAPGNVVQEDKRIVSYSAGTMLRNFNLGQTMYNYDYFNRSNKTGANGDPQLSTPNAAQVLQATLQHVVVTFDPVVGRKIYVNGVLKSQQDTVAGGTLGDWDDTYAFVLGNEVSGDRAWAGVIRLVAVFNRALTVDQIKQNYDAGVGQKFFLMFDVSALTDVSQSYVVFEATQYDSWSYLFRKPFFISLNEAAQPNGIDIQGMRVGLNGGESHVGQTYANLNTTISNTVYNSSEGQRLTDLGAVLPLEKGPDADEFFLTFDKIGTHTFARTPPTTPQPPTPVDLPKAADIGVRTFDEIGATMSVLTGVSQLDNGVKTTFDTVRQSLPAVDTIDAFLSSHQVAITQLAIGYCNALINDAAKRSALFAGFDFNSAWPASGGAEDLFLDPLLNRMLGATQLASQPDRAAAKTELMQLIHGIPGDGTRPGLANAPGVPPGATRTQTIAKATCAALLGSGSMLVQ